MTWIVSKTTKQNSVDYIQESFEWYQKFPTFIRSFSEPFMGKEIKDYTSSLLRGNNYVGIDNGVFTVLVHCEIKDSRTIEGHLICSKDTNLGLVSSVINFARIDSLKQCEIIICQVLKKHKFLNTVMAMTDFKDSGMRGYQHIHKDRFMEVIYYYTVK